MAGLGYTISFDSSGSAVVDWIINDRNGVPSLTPIDRAQRVLTNKGDILVKTATGFTRLPAGSIGQVLTADSGMTEGVKWATPSSSGPSDGDKGDIIVSSGGTVWSIDQSVAHTWGATQTFTVAPVFTDASGSRTALGLGSLATQSGTFSGTSSGTNTGDQTITLTGQVTGSGTGSFATTLATAQPDTHTWAATQTFTVAPVFTDASGTRTALGLGSLATQSGTFSGTSSGTNTGDQTITLTGAVTGSGTGTFATTQTMVPLAKGGTNADLSATGGTQQFLKQGSVGGSIVPTALPLEYDGFFGDGSDGDATIGSNTTLTRSMFYNNLTISSGFTLTSGGYRIHVNGTLTVNGTISRAGTAGSNASGASSGGAGSALSATDSGVSGAGGAGGAGTSGAGAAGGVVATLSNSASGAAGGTSGAGGAGTNAAGGSRGGGTATYRPYRCVALEWVTSTTTALSGGAGGGGGGSGGGDGTNSGGGGGGGGSGGGILPIYARTISVANTGAITADGGAGGNGGNSSAGNTGGGGGGAGGGGGVVFLLYGSLSNSGTITANGGAGGTGGSKTGSGVAGSAGNTGTNGIVLKYNALSRAWE